MIQQIGVALNFEAFFTANKVGKTGLTVTVDVFNHAGTQVVTAASATEVGDGLYTYQLAAGSNTGQGNYRAVFKTADATVDFQHVPSLWTVGETWVQNLDTNINSRSTYAGGPVASVTGNVGGSVASVVGNVGGNVVGSVGSVAGNVSGSVGSVAGNVSGNVAGSVGSVVGNVGGNVIGNVNGNVLGTVILASNGLDAVLVESGITPGAGLVNDSGTQLASINARQGIALCISALAAVLSGAGTTTINIAPAAAPSAASRITATVDSGGLGNRLTVNLRVPT